MGWGKDVRRIGAYWIKVAEILAVLLHSEKRYYRGLPKVRVV